MTRLAIRPFGVTSTFQEFDRMFEEINRAFTTKSQQTNYPPYNILKLDENHYAYEIAVAGFSEDEIDVEVQDSYLTIRGSHEDKETDVSYIHKGISARSFVRTFPLTENVEVTSASFKNGILTVNLEYLVPEESKPKKIAIISNK
jgi:molecular chaperone IbpA